MQSNVSDLIVVTVAGIIYSKPDLLGLKRGFLHALLISHEKRNSSDRVW
jgi:hypothetical protein